MLVRNGPHLVCTCARGVGARSGSRDCNFTDHFPQTRSSSENYKATAGAGNAVLYTPAPFLAHVRAHTRPRDTRGFRYTFSTSTNVGKDARGSRLLVRVAFRRLLLIETSRHVEAMTQVSHSIIALFLQIPLKETART